MTKGEQAQLVAWRLRVLREAADEANVARVCRRFGLSRKSFYKWKQRHATHGDAGLCDRARTPHIVDPLTDDLGWGLSWTDEEIRVLLDERRVHTPAVRTLKRGQSDSPARGRPLVSMPDGVRTAGASSPQCPRPPRLPELRDRLNLVLNIACSSRSARASSSPTRASLLLTGRACRIDT